MNFTFTTFGELLREIREHRGMSLNDVSKRVGVKKDFIGKIERGQRSPTPELVNEFSTCYGVDEKDLHKLFYSQKVLDELDGVDKVSPILRLVEQRRKHPSIQVKIKEKSPPRTKPKRKYVKGGKNGKVKGLNLYLRENDKLTKKDRDTLFQEGENYISQVYDILSVSQSVEQIMLSVGNLDPDLSDRENVDIWNSFYDQHYGFFPEFVEKELRGQEYLGDPDVKNVKQEEEWPIKKLTWMDMVNKKKEIEGN